MLAICNGLWLRRKSLHVHSKKSLRDLVYVLDPGVISLPVMPSLQLMPYLGQVHLRTIDHSIMCQILVRLDIPPLSFTSFYK